MFTDIIYISGGSCKLHKISVKNEFISTVLYLLAFKQTPTSILFSQGKKYSEGCQMPLFKCLPPNMCTSINLHNIFSLKQLPFSSGCFKPNKGWKYSQFRHALTQTLSSGPSVHLQPTCWKTTNLDSRSTSSLVTWLGIAPKIKIYTVHEASKISPKFQFWKQIFT